MKGISIDLEKTKKALRLCVNRLIAQGKLDQLLITTNYDIKTIRNALATGSITPRMVQGLIEFLNVDINLLVGERDLLPWEEEELQSYANYEQLQPGNVLAKLYDVAKITDKVSDVLSAGQYSSTDTILKSIKNNTVSLRMKEAFIKGLGVNWTDLCNDTQEQLIKRVKNENGLSTPLSFETRILSRIKISELSIQGMIRHYLLQNVIINRQQEELSKLIGVYGYESIEDYIVNGLNSDQINKALVSILNLNEKALMQLIGSDILIEMYDGPLVELRCGGMFVEQDYELVMEIQPKESVNSITIDIIVSGSNEQPIYYEKLVVQFNKGEKTFTKHKIRGCKNRVFKINFNIRGKSNE